MSTSRQRYVQIVRFGNERRNNELERRFSDCWSAVANCLRTTLLAVGLCMYFGVWTYKFECVRLFFLSHLNMYRKCSFSGALQSAFVYVYTYVNESSANSVRTSSARRWTALVQQQLSGLLDKRALIPTGVTLNWMCVTWHWIERALG